jgi:fatty-acyl-CoA synthase
MHNHGLGSWMAKRRLKSPETAALVFDGDVITYRELADAADRVSALLWHRGIRKGDAVAFLGENSPQFIQVMFGVMQLGAVFVPVNTRLAPPEIAHVLLDSGTRALIHDAEFTERVAAAVDEGGIAHRMETGDGTPEHPGLAQLVRTTRAGHADAEVTLDDPAAIIYTSGTTGKAK